MCSKDAAVTAPTLQLYGAAVIYRRAPLGRPCAIRLLRARQACLARNVDEMEYQILPFTYCAYRVYPKSAEGDSLILAPGAKSLTFAVVVTSHEGSGGRKQNDMLP